jgi:peptidoglycan/LPS O-acetylase OafA/YrhL
MFDENIGYWIEKAIFRIAVPFYFISSGFLLGEKISAAKSLTDLKNFFIHYSKRLFVLLLVFEPISIFLNVILDIHNGNSFFKVIILQLRNIIFYPKGALWFIQACIVAVWIIYFFIKHNKKHLILPLSCILYLFAMICNSYYFLIENTVLKRIVDIYLYITSSARNGLFIGVLFLYLGIIISDINKNKKLHTSVICTSTFILYCLYLFELYMLQGNTMKDDGSLFVILPLFCASLCLLCVRFTSSSTNTKIFRNLSTGVYLIHAPLGFFKYVSILLFKFNPKGIIHFLFISLASVCICLISYKSKNSKISNLLR